MNIMEGASTPQDPTDVVASKVSQGLGVRSILMNVNPVRVRIWVSPRTIEIKCRLFFLYLLKKCKINLNVFYFILIYRNLSG